MCSAVTERDSSFFNFILITLILIGWIGWWYDTCNKVRI